MAEQSRDDATEILSMMESVRAELIAIAAAQGDEGFVPEVDCAAWQWWLSQDVKTVAEFIDRVVERFEIGEVKQGWICSFLFASWDVLDMPLRERLVKLLDGSRAALIVMRKAGFTQGETAHLRTACGAYFRDRPGFQQIAERKLGDG